MAGDQSWHRRVVARIAPVRTAGADDPQGFQRSPSGDGTVVVEQSLDSATVIQFFQQPAVAWGERNDSLAQAGALALRPAKGAAAPALAAEAAALRESETRAPPGRCEVTRGCAERAHCGFAHARTTENSHIHTTSQVEPLPQHLPRPRRQSKAFFFSPPNPGGPRRPLKQKKKTPGGPRGASPPAYHTPYAILRPSSPTRHARPGFTKPARRHVARLLATRDAFC